LTPIPIDDCLSQTIAWRLGDVLRYAILVTIAGKQLGPGVHIVVSVPGGVPDPALAATSKRAYSGEHVRAEWSEDTLECSERLLCASHRACNLGHDLPDFGTTCTFATNVACALSSGCRFHFGDEPLVRARIATSPEEDRRRKRTADTTRPFH
jgi:hypothetical protein